MIKDDMNLIGGPLIRRLDISPADQAGDALPRTVTCSTSAPATTPAPLTPFQNQKSKTRTGAASINSSGQ
jgi:hypothetical protein